MDKHPQNDPLNSLLAYHEAPAADDFTQRVMRGVKRQQKMRRAILWGSGLVGAAFGAFGVLTLAEPLGQLLTAGNPLTVGLGVIGVVGFGVWLFQDETGATG